MITMFLENHKRDFNNYHILQFKHIFNNWLKTLIFANNIIL